MTHLDFRTDPRGFRVYGVDNLFKTLLNVSRDATREELKSSFIQLARVYHPDNNPSPDAAGKFQQLQELGYNCISLGIDYTLKWSASSRRLRPYAAPCGIWGTDSRRRSPDSGPSDHGKTHPTLLL